MTRLLPPLRTLLPAEHGTWFMLGFPLVLGLLLRPSIASLCLGLAAAAFFLSRPALRRVLNGQKDPAQLRALLLLGSLALGMGIATWIFSDFKFLIPLSGISPLVFLALRADLDRAVRSLSVEIAAQGAFAGLAASMLAAGGDTLASAGRAWLLVTLVGAANLAYVRRFLAQAHGMSAAELRQRRIPVHVLHLLLLVASFLLLATRNQAGALWTAWTFLLYLRALAPYRPMPARRLGWREGALSVLGLVLLWRALL
ncbi:YwiC-like family protein [Geothrix sp. PMB-07]|uniref:YwiC-like family protein n=1 Tax=Geothrix sp. PMB-07 TaxID=3068640 RepID=UPI002741F21B|nr:YwiC-like family protein [Geothrix sp. PMB-07]WLT32063.1 YwiC-like family protein [Geothrix sp. PMB-07]